MVLYENMKSITTLCSDYVPDDVCIMSGFYCGRNLDAE